MPALRIIRRLRDLSDVDWSAISDGEFLKRDGDEIVGEAGGGGGVSDHGALTGLADDDHQQYHTDARGDARYYTEAEVDALIAAVGVTGQVFIPAVGAPFANFRWATRFQTSTHYLASGIQSTGSAVGDWIEYQVYLQAGTYTLSLFHRKSVNLGIYTISIDGVDLGTTVDGYAAVAANGFNEIANIVIPSSELHTIRLTINTRNASNTTGWFGIVNLLQLTRTGA